MGDFFYISTENFYCRYRADEKPNPDDFKMHTHTECELYYFISGIGSFYVEGNKYPLLPGDILIMNNTESHYIDINPEAPYERMAIHFKKDFIKTLDKDGYLLNAFENRHVGKCNLFRAEDFESDTYQLFLKNILKSSQNQELQLSINLFSLLNEIAVAYNNSKPEHISVRESQAQKIIKYIIENLENPLSLDLICEEFFLSKPQLCRIFKKSTGSSVWNYITIKRLLKAKNMIDFGFSPTAIYNECGFSEYSVFFRAYKKYFGTSPTKIVR